MQFPVEFSIGTSKWHAHFLLDLIAYTIGFQVFLRLRRKESDALTALQRLYIVTAAITGAALGSHLLERLDTGHLTLQGGKTIVGGLVGGLISVESVKKWIGIRVSTGDLFALPIAVGTMIGRIGCFLEGLADNTYGLPTSLPWGVDFGDGIRRHPTQLYEIFWVALLTSWLIWFQKKPHRSGDLFKGYMVGYLGWRLAIDFLKPGIAFLGMTAIQWVCLATLLYYGKDMPYLFGFREVPTNG